MSYKLYDAEIEYLESSGTQYIQLECNVPVGTYFAVGGVVIPIYTSTQQDYSVFGANPYSSFTAAFYSKNNTTNRITYTSIIGELGAAGGVGGGWGGEIGTEVSFELSTTEKVVNGVHTSISRPLRTAITAFRIFGGYQNTNRYPIRIKSFYIKKGNDTLYDLIPVRIGQVGYMYDKISKQLFGNSGTGSFVLGPDVAPGRYANEVAFLESWGNQYIDTGIKPSTDTKIELKCLYCKSGVGFTNYGALIGADDRANAYTLIHSDMANFTYGLEFSNNFANPQTRLLTFDSTASPRNMRVYDEGGSLVTTLTCIRGVFEVNQNLYLFAVNRSGTPVYGSNRILYCKIYDGDTLVRDYVPVEYNGIGYMYDKVSGLFFGNQGTGKFLFGSIAKACARSYTRRQLMVEGRKRLPYGYVELEYIQNTTGAWSTSAPYIITDIKPAADSEDGDTYSFEGAWSREGNLKSNFDGVFGADNGGSGASTWHLLYLNKSVTRMGINTNTNSSRIIHLSDGATGVKHTFKISSSSVTIDNTTTSAPTGKGYVITTNLMLFRRFPSGQGFPMKLYYFKVFKSGVLLMDLIPCKNRNNVVGMFDLVSKSFFGSANSGTFVAGKIIY